MRTSDMNTADIKSADMTTAELSVGGETLRVVTREGVGRPLLMIMGLGGSVELWAPLASELATSRPLIMLDTPGLTGASRWRYSIPETADLAHGVALMCGHDRYDLLGVSLGGLVAQSLARRHPDSVGRLVLSSTGASPLMALVTADPAALAILAAPARYLLPPLNRVLSRYMMGGRTRRDGSVADQYVGVREDRRPSLRGYYAQMLGTVGFDSSGWLSTLRHPTLVLHGADDPLVSVGNGRRLAGLLPHAELAVIEGGGHLIVFDQSQECATVIEHFLGGSDVLGAEDRRPARG